MLSVDFVARTTRSEKTKQWIELSFAFVLTTRVEDDLDRNVGISSPVVEEELDTIESGRRKDPRRSESGLKVDSN